MSSVSEQSKKSSINSLTSSSDTQKDVLSGQPSQDSASKCSQSDSMSWDDSEHEQMAIDYVEKANEEDDKMNSHQIEEDKVGDSYSQPKSQFYGSEAEVKNSNHEGHTVYQQIQPVSSTVRDDDPKQVSMLFFSRICNLISLCIVLYKSLVTLLPINLHYTVVAVLPIYQFIKLTVYLLTNYNNECKFTRLCALKNFFLLEINILIIIIMVFNKDSVSDIVYS